MKFVAIVSLWLIATWANAQTVPPSSLLVEPKSDVMSNTKLLVDVGFTTPLGGVIPVLAKGCSLPCNATQIFEPRPGGVQVTLKLARGVLDSAKTEVQLGTFRVTSSSEQPIPRTVQIRFLANEDGIWISTDSPSDASPLVISRIAP